MTQPTTCQFCLGPGRLSQPSVRIISKHTYHKLSLLPTHKGLNFKLAWAIVQLVGDLPSTHKALGSILSNPVTRHGGAGLQSQHLGSGGWRTEDQSYSRQHRKFELARLQKRGFFHFYPISSNTYRHWALGLSLKSDPKSCHLPVAVPSAAAIPLPFPQAQTQLSPATAVVCR